MPDSWPVRSSEDVWRGPAPFAVRRDLVSHPGVSEEVFGRLVVEHPGSVIVLAVDDEDRALVVQQYRHPAQARLVELPAGLLDVPGEDPLVTAQRELLEEAAHTAAEWLELVTVLPTPGLSSERHHYYLATGLRHVPDRGGFELAHEEADMTIDWVPVTELLAGIAAGRLQDGPLAFAILAYLAFGRNQRA